MCSCACDVLHKLLTGAFEVLFKEIDIVSEREILPDTRKDKVPNESFEVREANFVVCWTEP